VTSAATASSADSATFTPVQQQASEESARLAAARSIMRSVVDSSSENQS
jgi:hypothetical protein